MSKYIKVRDLQSFCDNQKDHAITPNDFQRMTQYDLGWHTGTPTKNGLYVVVIKVTDTLYYHRLSDWYKGFGFVVEHEGSKVHAWMRIEPYKEKHDGCFAD